MFWRLAPEDVRKNSLDVRFFRRLVPAFSSVRFRVRPFSSLLRDFPGICLGFENFLYVRRGKCCSVFSLCVFVSGSASFCRFFAVLLFLGSLFEKIFGSELVFGCWCWSCVFWWCFAEVLALYYGGSLPKVFGKIFLMSGLLFLKNFRERTFVFGVSVLVMCLLVLFCLCFCFMFWRCAPEDVWKTSLDVRSLRRLVPAFSSVRFRVRPFFSSLPPSCSSCSWGRPGFLFLSSCCVPAGHRPPEEGRALQHTTCTLALFLFSLPGPAPLSLPRFFLCSLFLSLSLSLRAFR